VEDGLNAAADTERGGVRILLVVASSPSRRSRLLPVLYRQIMVQTQAAIDEGLNEEQRLGRRRARTKVLVAETPTEAEELYQRYHPYLMGIACDRELAVDCRPDSRAGLAFLERVRRDAADLPLLLMDRDPDEDTRKAAEAIGAKLVDLSAESVPAFFEAYLRDHLGFGDFVFRTDDGREAGRAATVRELETLLPGMPGEPVLRHWKRNDFSRWLFARGEFALADRLRRLRNDIIEDPEAMKTFLAGVLRSRRIRRQMGVVADFRADACGPETAFAKAGDGSMGGKGRGLAFLAAQLQEHPDIQERFDAVRIAVPNTLVLATDLFDAFLDENELRLHSRTAMTDEDIAGRFLAARLPRRLAEDLRAFAEKVTWPLAVRSSSLLEDHQMHPYAGIYRTYMLPNADPDPGERFRQLADAVRLVYASTFYAEPRAFAERTGRRADEEKMAVVVQKMVGQRYGDLFYPVVSGVAQSYNYYPIAPMTPEDGIANIAMGLGVTVVGGERSLRFCPRYPRNLPQFSTVDDILANAQRFFYGLKMAEPRVSLGRSAETTLDKREIADVEDAAPLEWVAGSYSPEEHRVKDGYTAGSHPVATFARILKYDAVPLAEVLCRMLDLGEKAMGCPVDIEFSLNAPAGHGEKPELALLQIRPMAARKELVSIDIDEGEISGAVCYSGHALGNGVIGDLRDIVFVKPENFDPARTADIAREIGRLNAGLVKAGRTYLLVGPGRWGSQDPWLGIPVQWAEISGASVIVETTHESFRPDPSQGSHFFHNLTSLNLSYFTIAEDADDRIDWKWFQSRPVEKVSRFLSHVRLDRPMTVKVDGKTSRGVVIG
jgi:hypothetical protein